jgi:hypothetical protein
MCSSASRDGGRIPPLHNGIHSRLEIILHWMMHQKAGWRPIRTVSLAFAGHCNEESRITVGKLILPCDLPKLRIQDWLRTRLSSVLLRSQPTASSSIQPNQTHRPQQ